MIDVSGDGVNNNGPPVTMARDEALAKGITINGLPIMLKRPMSSTMDIDNLDVYFEDRAIGGPGAFVIPIKERHQFKEAIRTKLILKIAGRPAAAGGAGGGARTAGLLHDRRADLARALGESTIARPWISRVRGNERGKAALSARTWQRSRREANSETGRPA